MIQWITLLKKELLEMTRNFKLVWVPLTFILLGVTQPLSSYYMPQIIDKFGGLPKGTVIKIPEPSAAEVLVKGLSQYTTIGVLIIVLLTMGLIAGERKSGVAAMVLVKPVSFLSFVTSKWAGAVILFSLSFFSGYLATWYYTGVLYDWIALPVFFQSYLLYMLWFIAVLTLTLFFSSILLSSGMAGFFSLGIVMVSSLVSGMLEHWLKYSPSRLTDYANVLLLSGKIPKETIGAGLVAGSLVLVLLFLAMAIFRKKELAS